MKHGNDAKAVALAMAMAGQKTGASVSEALTAVTLLMAAMIRMAGPKALWPRLLETHTKGIELILGDGTDEDIEAFRAQVGLTQETKQ